MPVAVLKPLKWSFYGILLLTLTVVGAVAFLIFAVDPNWLRPEIEKHLSKQGFNLQLESDVSWQFYPNFGLQVSEAVLLDESSENRLLTVGRVDFSLALAPLLDRRIEVVALNLRDTEATYVVYEDGSSNWDFLTKSQDVQANPTPEKENLEKKGVELSIANIEIENAALHVDDKQAKSSVTISDVHSIITDVSLSGGASSIDLRGAVLLSGFPELIFELHSKFQSNLENKVFSLDEAELSIQQGKNTLAKCILNATLEAEDSKIVSELSIELNKLRELFNIFGVDLPENLLDTALHNALLTSDVLLVYKNDIDLRLPNISIAVDDTSLDGNAKFMLSQGNTYPDVVLRLQSKSLNVDAFLKNPKGEKTVDADVKNDSQAVELPLEFIRDISAEVSVDIDTVTYNTLLMKNLKFETNADKGVVRLETLSAEIENGKVASSGVLNAHKKTPDIQAKVSTSKLDVGYLLEKIAGVSSLKGKLDSMFLLRSSGLNAKALQENMVAEFDATSSELRLVPVDLMKNVCEVVSLVEQNPLADRNWKAYTELSPIQLNANVAGSNVSLDKLFAKVEKFDAYAKGHFNLSTQSFDFPIELSLSDFAAELEGCNFISDEWRKKTFPLRCKGNLQGIDAKTCQPNYSLIREKWKNKIEDKVDAEKERAKERVEDKVKDKIKDKIGDKVSEEELERLKDIFKR